MNQQSLLYLATYCDIHKELEIEGIGIPRGEDTTADLMEAAIFGLDPFQPHNQRKAEERQVLECLLLMQTPDSPYVN